MPKCPFAAQDPVTRHGSVLTGGTYSGGPFKIVHHTTEGPSIASARGAYVDTGNLPHFTVDASRIVQHLDTGRSATALANRSGGVETNRDSAVQIEVVGKAISPKPKGTLANIARLCRWIEETHQVARDWPNGLPKPPGSAHNRDAMTWNNRSGHYGHCHVPENSHEDPGYTAEEVKVVMGHAGVLVSVEGQPVAEGAGFLDGNAAWAAIRPVIEAMGGSVNPAPTDHAAVVVEFRGQTITIAARGVAAGTAFVPLRELRRLTGVQVNFTPGAQPTVDILLPGV